MPINFYENDQGCKPTVKITDNGNMSTYQKLCYIQEKMIEIIEIVNQFETDITNKEDSSNITNNRKLSENGDFTGTLCGKKSACQTVSEIDNNRDQIQFIANQFSDGQTGLVVDGGFFIETGIKASYNGGYF